LLVAGCTLIDQRTFRSAASPGPADTATPAPALPLLTVHVGTESDTDAIPGAVQLAMARNPGTVFEVVAPIPISVPRATQEAAVRQAQGDAEQVATAIAAAGAARDHIQLGLRADPGVPGREVRIYAR
jgi:hypothetical protein